MIGGSFYFFHPLSILDRKLGEYLIDEGLLLNNKLQLLLVIASYLLLKYELKPLKLYEYSVFHQSIFRKIASQII